MNREEIEIFKKNLKHLLNKNGAYTKQEIYYFMLILDVLIAYRRKFAVSASAKRYNFDFGIRASEKYQQLTEAITLFERTISKDLCPPSNKQ